MRLAIDLGGTNIRIAQVAEGKCLKRNSVACLATQDVDVILTQLFELIEPMIGETVEGIGIGVPSIVDTVHGIVYDAMNIASWKEVHLKELLEEKFGLLLKHLNIWLFLVCWLCPKCSGRNLNIKILCFLLAGWIRSSNGWTIVR